VDIHLTVIGIRYMRSSRIRGLRVKVDENVRQQSTSSHGNPHSRPAPNSRLHERVHRQARFRSRWQDGLLTVLLHEYGHALGLDHDESTHQLMSEELQPGVRHTMSDAEMSKLWSLIGEQNGDALTLALSRGAGEGTDVRLCESIFASFSLPCVRACV
jgi:hypothetical protein